MEEKKKDICRLCLKCESITSPLDESSKENLKVVVPELNLDATTNFVICSKCKDSLVESCKLKKICSETVHVVETQIKKRNIKDKVNLNHIIESPNVENICRVCLKDNNVNYVTIKTSNDLTIAALKSCLPELDVELTVDPVICETCHNMLRYMFSFKNECLSVEEKLKRYSETTSENEVDLSKVLTFLEAETEKAVGEDNFLSGFDVADEEELDMFDTLPDSSGESSASENNARQTAGNYDNDAANNSGAENSRMEKKLRCYSCRRYGHTKSECLQTFKILDKGGVVDLRPPRTEPGARPVPWGTCVYCGKLGHANKKCWNMGFTDDILRPPKPPNMVGASSAGPQNQVNETNLTKEARAKKLRQEYLAKLGCLRCFRFGHSEKICKKVKYQERLARTAELRRAKLLAKRGESAKRHAGSISPPKPQSRNRGMSGSRPQYHNDKRYTSLGSTPKPQSQNSASGSRPQYYNDERSTGFVSTPKPQSQNSASGSRPQYYNDERSTGFVSTPKPQSQNSASSSRPQYYNDERYRSFVSTPKPHSQSRGVSDYRPQYHNNERYTDFVSTSKPQSQNRDVPSFRPQYRIHERYYSKEMRDYGEYSGRYFRN